MVAKDERLVVLWRRERADCRANEIEIDAPTRKPYRKTLND